MNRKQYALDALRNQRLMSTGLFAQQKKQKLSRRGLDQAVQR